MQLSIIIVNYNVRYFLEQALLSVRAATQQIAAEVWVVDNASNDDSVDLVRERFPEVQLISNTDNVGFSIANNQAIRQASGDYILLLNPDTVVEEGTFRQCINFMEAHPKAGALGVRMIDGSGTFLPESKRGFPTPWVAFCKATGLSKLFPQSRLFNRYHLGFLSEHETHPVDVLPGAFMFIRKEALNQSGLLDENFFMYGEDIDLSYRIQQAGWQNYYFPEARIIHYKGESTKKGSLNYVRTFYQAMIIFARKHFSGPRAGLYIGFLKAGIYFRAIVTVLRQWWRRIRMPLADALLMLLGLFFLQKGWGSFRFDNSEYYGQQFMQINAPLYSLLWVAGIVFSGGYDKPFRAGRIGRGLLLGTLVIAAIYGFLPTTYRNSRALILLGLAWSLSAVMLSRAVWYYQKCKRFNWLDSQLKRVLIVGHAEESERVRSLLQSAHSSLQVVGVVNPEDEQKKDLYLGTLPQLADLVRIYQVQEIIFCSADVATHRILSCMSQMGAQYNYKILPPDSLSIIGSHSKHSSGELYTVDISFQIDQPLQRRNKRIFDLIVALLLGLLYPFLFWRYPVRILSAGWRVLRGKATWVGYALEKHDLELPQLRPGVYSPADGLQDVAPPDVETLERLDLLYARDYSVADDLRISWKALLGNRK